MPVPDPVPRPADGAADDDWVITLDDLADQGAKYLAEHPSCLQTVAEEIRPDQLATLIYTSGTTGRSKGVMVSHGNLLHNQEMIRQAFGQSAASVIVGWLPLYHDMGLIGNVLQPLYVGARCVLMSPLAFLARPARWLRARPAPSPRSRPTSAMPAMRNRRPTRWRTSTSPAAAAAVPAITRRSTPAAPRDSQQTVPLSPPASTPTHSPTSNPPPSHHPTKIRQLSILVIHRA